MNKAARDAIQTAIENAEDDIRRSEGHVPSNYANTLRAKIAALKEALQEEDRS